LTSFTYKDVGINVEMTPRVTVEGDVILDILVENSTRANDVNIAGQNLPSFGSRRVTTRLRLRDGESNLLAGLLREDERKALRGLPGLVRLPILNKLFASNDNEVRTTDIVMLLTPRIVRTQEITASDISPIFIGTQQNLGLGGPPPLIAPQPEPAPPAGPAVVPQPGTAPPGGGVSIAPPGSGPIPGTTSVPAAPSPAPPNAATPQGAAAGAPPPAPAATAPPVNPPIASAGAQIVVTPPGTDFRVGGGPYTVAVSATNASRLSGLSLTITFNPAALRVRAVQEGSFMRAGGAQAAFTQQVDAASGRIDIVILRTADATGVAGTGLLAAVLFDAVGGGAANLAITGTATAPGGTPASLVITPVPAITVR
jgi:general secretion pathway protein D